MNDDLELLVDTTRRILAATVWTPEHAEPLAWPSDEWRHLDEAGLTGLSIDERHGGSGGSFLDAATVVFEVGRAAAVLPMAETVMATRLAAEVGWSRTGGAETMADGIGSVTLQVRGNELAFSGALRNVPWASEVCRILVFAELKGNPIVGSVNPAEVTVERRYNLAGEPRDLVVLDELVLSSDRWAWVPVPVTQLRERAAVLRCIAAAGAMTTVAEMTIEYAGSRTQFGRSIGQFQAVQQMLAVLQGQVAAAVTAARTAAGLIADGDTEAGLALIAAIVRVLRAIPDATRIAHQVHGAIGITQEHPLHRWTTRLWSARADCGGEAGWSAALMRRLEDLGGASQLWPSLTR